MDNLFELEVSPITPGLPAREYPFHVNPWGDIQLAMKAMAQREAFIVSYGYCLVTQEVLSALASLLRKKQVLEVGCGSGWLAQQLADRKIDITAADKANYSVPAEAGDGFPIAKVYRLDYQGDAVGLLPGQFDVVLMSWPDYESSFAAEVGRAMKPGQLLVFEGEGEGGCTGDDAFFELLSSSFEEQVAQSRRLNAGHVQFPGIHDLWSVWVKR